MAETKLTKGKNKKHSKRLFEQKVTKATKLEGCLHKDYRRADEWSSKVIGAAIEVHRIKGPGLLEEIYEKCLMRELQLQHIPAENQVVVPIEYKGLRFQEPLKLDVYVDRCLIVELKAVEYILPIHKAQLMSYMKLLDAPIGLLVNFHETTIKKGIRRLILPGSNTEDVDF